MFHSKLNKLYIYLFKLTCFPPGKLVSTTFTNTGGLLLSAFNNANGVCLVARATLIGYVFIGSTMTPEPHDTSLVHMSGAGDSLGKSQGMVWDGGAGIQLDVEGPSIAGRYGPTEEDTSHCSGGGCLKQVVMKVFFA